MCYNTRLPREASSHLPSPNPPHKARWIEKLSHMDFTRCPPLLFGCWLYGRVCHRDSKPLKTIGHSHTDSLRRIGEASLVPRKRSACSSEGSAHQTSWHHCRHPPNLPAIPISATRGLAIDNGEVSWTRSSCLVHVLHSSQRHQGRSHRDDLEPSSLSSHRHRVTIRALQSAGTVDA